MHLIACLYCINTKAIGFQIKPHDDFCLNIAELQFLVWMGLDYILKVLLLKDKFSIFFITDLLKCYPL